MAVETMLLLDTKCLHKTEEIQEIKRQKMLKAFSSFRFL